MRATKESSWYSSHRELSLFTPKVSRIPVEVSRPDESFRRKISVKILFYAIAFVTKKSEQEIDIRIFRGRDISSGTQLERKQICLFMCQTSHHDYREKNSADNKPERLFSCGDKLEVCLWLITQIIAHKCINRMFNCQETETWGMTSGEEEENLTLLAATKKFPSQSCVDDDSDETLSITRKSIWASMRTICWALFPSLYFRWNRFVFFSFIGSQCEPHIIFWSDYTFCCR